METNQAAEHLQVIRTLMERSALYRRALAPIMIFAGTIGILAAVVSGWFKPQSDSAFIIYWMIVALVGLVGAFFLVRRQALKSSEPFWSPPTRRVALAMSPPFTAGFVIGVLFFLATSKAMAADAPTGMAGDAGHLAVLVSIWAILYGCGLHAAGFFTPRGLRWFGWIFVAAGSGILIWMFAAHRQDFPDASLQNCHWLMGLLFGVLQLAYGIYLYFTEPRKNVA